MASGITVKCVYCGAKKTLSVEEARRHSGPPMCEKDGGVMVIVSGRVSSRKTKTDLREVMRNVAG